MAIKLTQISLTHKNQLESEYPFVWLYEIQTAEATPRRYRFTNYTELITFRGNSYFPFHVIHGGIAQKTDGAVPRIDITIGIQSIELAPIIDGEDGMVGNKARIIIVSLLELDNTLAAVQYDGVVEGVSMEEERTTFGISGHNSFRSRFPGHVFSKRKCRFPFGGSGCGYDINLGLYDQCGTKKDGTLVAAAFTLAACRVIGEDEVLSGLTPQHPKRFGGFPAIKPAHPH